MMSIGSKDCFIKRRSASISKQRCEPRGRCCFCHVSRNGQSDAALRWKELCFKKARSYWITKLPTSKLKKKDISSISRPLYKALCHSKITSVFAAKSSFPIIWTRNFSLGMKAKSPNKLDMNKSNKRSLVKRLAISGFSYKVGMI